MSARKPADTSAQNPARAGFVDAPSRLSHLQCEDNSPRRPVLHRLRCCLLVMGLLGTPGLAFSQAKPAFTADQIVERFSSPGALGNARGLGTERKVCIGTESDCRAAPQPTIAAGNTASFDLMIQFGLDSDRLTEAAQRNLDEFAAALVDPRLKVMRFAVEGHTDARGSDDHNLDLSQRRAQAVARYLETKGVERDRVLPKAFGSARPRTDNPLDATNRRVETRLAQ